MALDFIDYEQLLKEATVHFSRSSGKGGQNVNKVETAVELIFNIPHSSLLTDAAKKTLLAVLKSRIDTEGNIHIKATTERLQLSNRKKAEEKFIALIKKGLTPKKKRVKTAPTRAQKMKRLESKKRQSTKKKARTVDFL